MSYVSEKTLTCKDSARSTLVWSAEFPINQCELLRAELRQNKTHAVLDLRRWFKQSTGSARSTERGFAISVQHLPAIEALICEALARAAGLGERRTINGGVS